jgi:hypothetical protein
LNRGKKSPAVPPKTAPAGRPLPGSVAVTLGAAPNHQELKLQKLTTASRWFLSRGEDGMISLVDEPAAGAASVAVLSIGEKNRLQLAAEGDTQFHEIRGTNIQGSNSGLLTLQPGDILACRVASATTAGKPVPLKLSYLKES